MYLPAHFAEARPEEIARIILDHPLAVLIGSGPQGLVANHIPLLAEGPEKIIGHVALNNDFHREIADGAEVMAVFRAAEGYVSPNWYPTKQDHHRQVPTWNYQAIHVYGTIRFLRERKEKTAVVGKLTKHFEPRVNGDRAWRMADAPRDYMEQMLDNIVAFEIAVTRTIAKSKLSQNKEAVDKQGAIERLEASGNADLAGAMRALAEKG